MSDVHLAKIQVKRIRRVERVRVAAVLESEFAELKRHCD